MNEHQLTCVLITPARNEEEFIGVTIRSMLRQKIRPIKWVIVSDGSRDRTDEIVRGYAAQNEWIELVQMPERAERHFAGKVRAFNAGYAKVRNLAYDVIGNLDADVSFDPDYLEFLLGKFAENPKLGVAGTNRWEGSIMYDYKFTSAEDVAGACQLFRRECFESIGGYKPIKGGGIDLVATLTARMLGWQTRSYTDKLLCHHRVSGTAVGNRYMIHFNNGKKDYMFGGHPLWEVFRAAYRLPKRPLIAGACFLLAGYFWSLLTRVERPVTLEFIAFRRREQMIRLRRLFSGLLARSTRSRSRALGKQSREDVVP
jgi:biofilm PGA synthesis N-glycosyltransferase PgaC